MSYIWVPRTKIIEVNPPGPTSKIAGWFKIIATKADGSGRSRVLADWFPNLITDYGINSLGTISNPTNYIHIGTSNTVPDVTDTGLFGWVASSAGSAGGGGSGNSPGGAYYGYTRIVRRFNPGVAVGTFAEVGVGRLSTNSDLFSRALILDGSAQPTTIPVLADVYLDVYYELRNYPGDRDVDGQTPLDPVQAGQTITGVGTRSFTWRPSIVTNLQWAPNSFPISSDGATGAVAYNGAIGAVTGSPSGTSIASDTFSPTAYSNNSLQRTATAVWGVNDVLTGIRCFRLLWQIGCYQCEMDTPFDLDNTQTLSMTWTVSWARL